MVLYVTQKGFRFPYPRWTDISAAANGRFLETQLDQYLHRHYEDGGVLYTEQTGFRVPRKHGLDSLEENMRFVEAQLDKYLHEHDAAVAAAAGDLFPAGSIETSNGQGPAGNEVPYWRVISGSLLWYWPSVGLFTPQTIDPADYNYMVQGSSTGLNHFVVSSVNPDTGTYHLRTGTVANNATVNLAVGNGASGLNSQGGPVKFDIIDGGEYTVTWRVACSNSTSLSDEVINPIIQTMNAAGDRSFFQSTEIAPTLNTGAYETITASFTFTGYTAGHTMWTPMINMFWNGLSTPANYATFDIDNITVTGPDGTTILYWTPRGFRFPYDWKRPDAIDHNRRFLETELSTYLHIHEGS